MRWMWIDRFVEFEAGRRAVAIKNVSIVEEQMDGYLPGFPVMPPSLIIEGLALTGGLLVAEQSGFLERVVLAKIGRAVFHFPAVAGDQLTYTAVVESIQPNGAICQCTSYRGSELHAELDVMFAHLDDRFKGIDLFRPEDLVCMLRVFRLFEVGRAADGGRIAVPKHMVEAEQALMAGNTESASVRG